MIDVKIINRSNNPDPSYSTIGSAGVDLRAFLPEPITIRPGEHLIVPTGLYMELPEGYEAQVRPRSGLAAKHGIAVLNTPGTIDCVTGDTIVNLPDKSTDTLLNVINRFKNGESIKLLSLNSNHEVVYGEVTNVASKGLKSILSIKFEDGQVLKCTRNHEIMLGNGRYKIACNLKPGLSAISVVDDEIISNEVIEVTDAGIEEVYDITIKDYHNFVANSIIVHNCDYRGEVGVILINHGGSDYVINNGDRIAQMVINKYESVNFIKSDELTSSDRSSGGFGHTGVK